MSFAETKDELKNAFIDILKTHDIGKLPTDNDKYSGIFLPNLTKNYFTSNKKIMVVGQETKAWNGNLAKFQVSTDVESYVQSTMTENYLPWLNKKPGKLRFLQFLHQVDTQTNQNKKNGSVSVIWSNLFSLSYNRASPVNKPHFETVNDLSKQLFQAQLRILKPDAIIFTSGWRYDEYIKDFVEESRLKTITVNPKKLWTFNIDNIRCYRTSHPRYAADNEFRQQAIQDLNNFLK